MSLLQNSNAISTGGYDVNNSLRFRSSASAYLSRTPTLATNRTTMTFSAWIKRGTLGVVQSIFDARTTSSPYSLFHFYSNDTLVYEDSNTTFLQTTQVFRDPSAWYHLVLTIDTTQATAANRVKIYVNGNQITALSTATYPSQNANTNYNTATAHAISSQIPAFSNEYFDGYMAEVNFIDGQALTPSSFGETDPVTGSWIAKKYTGTYGTNGFYLPFSNAEANENRFLYSEDFTNAAWGKGASTITSNSVVAPDGTTTGDTLTDNATSDQHLVYQAIPTPLVGSEYTVSIYAKANTRTQIGLTMHGEGVAVFDLSAGTVVGTGGYSNYGIQSVGNGWYRCYVTIRKTNAEVNVYYIIFKDAVNPYLGTGTGSIYIWGAQVTYGSTLTKYIPTTTATVTNQGIAENKVLYSEDATNAAWNKIAVTATANTTTAPNGTSTADSILETATTGLHVLLPTTSLTLAAATVHTASLYVKRINNQYIQLVLDDTATTNGGYANYDIVNGTVTASGNYGIGFGISSSITSVGNGWYRISLSTSIGSGTTARFAINACQSGSSGLFPSYLGNVSNGYYVWGMQVEENSTVGPYLPTTSAAQGKVHRIGADKSLGSTSFGYSSWIPNNISLTPGTTYDAMTDSPSLTSATVGNYAILNTIDKAGFTIANGNLSVTAQSSASGVTGSIALPTSGKYYWECICLTGSERFFGIINAVHTAAQLGTVSATQWVLYGTTNAGTTIINKDNTNVQTGLTAINANNVIGIAYNADAGTIQFYNNNVAIGTAVSFTTGITYVPWITSGNNAFNNFTGSINFGQQPFSYTPPTGFVRLNTYNLPTPTILRGNKYMDATTYTGNATNRSITNAGGFKPDLIWFKNRSTADYHNLYDSNRGATRFLFSNTADAEGSSGGGLQSFDSTGFSIYGFLANVNGNGNGIVAWQWQAGQGTNTTNTSGTITSIVSANPTAGFSIVTYTGTGSAASIGHGLGVGPEFIIVKRRDATNNWMVVSRYLSNYNWYVKLNLTDAQVGDATIGNIDPNITTFNVGTNAIDNASGGTYVAYVFAPIAGFSKFGSYIGNGSTDGPFVYLGFRPKFFMTKRIDTTGNWKLHDTSRDIYNVTGNTLYPNSSSAEVGSDSLFDMLSNGIKLRDTNADTNANGGTYIYAAFAESPFKNANAR